MSKSAILILISLATLAAVSVTGAAAEGRFVGGRMDITNVKENKEVQELGRYSVEEYNRKAELLRRRDERVVFRSREMGAPLSFVEVVEAQRQVVAGIKYFLTVETLQGGVRRVFEAQVVVKPWLLSKQLVSFAPSKFF